eukprot:838114-Prymnesium_polylepis.1
MHKAEEEDQLRHRASGRQEGCQCLSEGGVSSTAAAHPHSTMVLEQAAMISVRLHGRDAYRAETLNNFFHAVTPVHAIDLPPAGVTKCSCSSREPWHAWDDVPFMRWEDAC